MQRGGLSWKLEVFKVQRKPWAWMKLPRADSVFLRNPIGIKSSPRPRTESSRCRKNTRRRHLVFQERDLLGALNVLRG